VTKVRAFTLTSAGILILVLGYVANGAERAIAQRREYRAEKPDYWRCDRLPNDIVLQRVFVQRMLRDSELRSFGRGVWFWLFYPYVSIKVNRSELVDDFLKTPSMREKGCAEVLDTLP
jgi:hypothetical protein